MKNRPLVQFDAAILPEWIDFGLEKFIQSKSEVELRKTLQNFLAPQIGDEVTLGKTVLQIQRICGYKSIQKKETLQELLFELGEVDANQRNSIRFKLLQESNVFFSDCVDCLKRLQSSGVEQIEIKHVYERIVRKYGDREAIRRRVRLVMQTLASFNAIENKNGKWILTDNYKSSH
jgi:hypothetical protein